MFLYRSIDVLLTLVFRLIYVPLIIIYISQFFIFDAHLLANLYVFDTHFCANLCIFGNHLSLTLIYRSVYVFYHAFIGQTLLHSSMHLTGVMKHCVQPLVVMMDVFMKLYMKWPKNRP